MLGPLGKPVVVTVNVPADPSVKLVWSALVMVGDCWTFRVKLALVIKPQLSVARIVIVCDPIGAALLIETTPVVLSTPMVPV
jgi:hypothetical protein